MRFAWDDLAVFLALFRERTTGRAAAQLGVSQPTVGRRIAGLEQALGLTLFERSPTGLEPTCAARELLPAAEQVERSICEFSGRAAELAGSGENIIRLTFIDHFERMLIPVMRSFRERWPGVQIELLAADRMYDLARGEADIAIRGRTRPDEEGLVVHQLPNCGWTVYASAHTPRERLPTRPEEVAGQRIAILDGPPAANLAVYRWLSEQAALGPAPVRCTSFGALRFAIAAGSALSVLPCTVGDDDPELVRCFPPMPLVDVEVYLIARRAALRRRPVRDLFDSIAAFFTEHPELLTGLRD